MNNMKKKFPMDVFPSCSSIGIRMWQQKQQQQKQQTTAETTTVARNYHSSNRPQSHSKGTGKL